MQSIYFTSLASAFKAKEKARLRGWQGAMCSGAQWARLQTVSSVLGTDALRDLPRGTEGTELSSPLPLLLLLHLSILACT